MRWLSLLGEASLKSNSLLGMESLEITISGIVFEQAQSGRRSVNRVFAQASRLFEVDEVGALGPAEICGTRSRGSESDSLARVKLLDRFAEHAA